MAGTILVAYGTKHGSTREVAHAIAETLKARGFDTDARPAIGVDDLSLYAGVVLGGAIYMGRWHPDAIDFLERHRHELATIPVAVFGMGPRTLDERDVGQSAAQVRKALDKVPEVVPFTVTVFGGVVDPSSLKFPFNRMPATDARDWGEIRAWAVRLAGVFGLCVASEPAALKTAVVAP